MPCVPLTTCSGVDTTRQPRPGETTGKEYHFVERETFQQMIEEDRFVEYTQFANNYYGTSKTAIEAIQGSGRRCVLDIDLQGVKSVRRLGLLAQIVFITPPSMAELGLRLQGRGTESIASLAERLQAAEQDLADLAANPELCDITVVNDSLDQAYEQIAAFIFNRS